MYGYDEDDNVRPLKIRNIAPRPIFPDLSGIFDTSPREAPGLVDPDDLDFDDLVFLAERLMLSAIAKIDWADLGESLAPVVVDDEQDVKDIVRIMKGATVRIEFGS